MGVWSEEERKKTKGESGGRETIPGVREREGEIATERRKTLLRLGSGHENLSPGVVLGEPQPINNLMLPINVMKPLGLP